MSEEQVVETAVDADLELEEEEVQEEEVSPEVAAFRADLRSKPGEWFVVHSYAGFEKRVKGNLLQRIQSMQDRKSTRLNSSHTDISRMPSSA